MEPKIKLEMETEEEADSQSHILHNTIRNKIKTSLKRRDPKNTAENDFRDTPDTDCIELTVCLC